MVPFIKKKKLRFKQNMQGNPLPDIPEVNEGVTGAGRQKVGVTEAPAHVTKMNSIISTMQDRGV